MIINVFHIFRIVKAPEAPGKMKKIHNWRFFIHPLVRRFPPPSRIYELCYIGAETREEGGTCCLRALAAEGVKTARGCPRRWYWSLVKGGTETRMPCSWVEYTLMTLHDEMCSGDALTQSCHDSLYHKSDRSSINTQRWSGTAASFTRERELREEVR
ncbi:hypothetical protein DPX16_8256 [Anabarilius grahami]|uniref:Uncharacterized protein n=1 Tax=Anabarilius grahami TaxID=495550 RepID=A0A3N0Y8A0_ANAGA|nr:hypothetical protein DPX16_8256 [Anabarilius grahami]